MPWHNSIFWLDFTRRRNGTEWVIWSENDWKSGVMLSSGKKKEWMLKNRTMMGALRHRLWMESRVWMRFTLGGKISVNFDGLVRPASRLGHQITRRIQQIFLHFCKLAFDGVVNSLSLAQSVDWSILFVQLYEQTIQGVLYNALSLSSADALSPDPRVDVLQCLQKRHSPCHEMDWVGFYWASYLLSSSW